MVDLDTRCSGHWIVAQPGVGKTNALLCMIAEDLEKGASVIIIDPKGGPDGLTERIGKLALGNRLVVLDPDRPFAINPLDVDKTDVKRAVDQVKYIFGVLLAEVTPKQESFLRALLRALIIAFPNPNLETIYHLVLYGWKDYEQYIQLLPRELQHFFHVQWGSYDATRSELNWRLNLLTENPLVQKMFSAHHTRYNVAAGMDRGDVFLIDNSIEKLHEDGSAFLGRFFIGQIWGAAMARSSRQRSEKRPVFVYIDEADLVIRNDPTIASIIDRCRSQNIALICAMQRAEQIEHKQVRSALENCAIKMANVDGELSYFSTLLRIPEERMPKSEQKGLFATSIRGQTSMTQFPVAKLPFRDMTPAEQKAHRQRMIDLYGTPKPPEGASSGGARCDSKPLAPLQNKPEAAQPTLSSTPEPSISRPANDPHAGDHTEPSSKWGEE